MMQQINSSLTASIYKVGQKTGATLFYGLWLRNIE